MSSHALRARRRGAPAALVLFSALALAACGGPKGEPGGGEAAEVGIINVTPQLVTLTTELSGRTSALMTSDVRPQITGLIKARAFTEGGLVHAGQTLYQVDPATYEASLASAQATLAQAQASYDAAKLKADRYKDLVLAHAVSRQDNEDAQSSAAQAEANVAIQKAAVRQAQINLGYTRIPAPISGRIGRSSVTPGALVTTGQATALATIQQMDPMYVDVSQSTSDLLKLKRDLAGGQLNEPASASVKLTLEDGSVYPLTGVLKFSEVTVDPGTGTVTVRAVFPNPKGVLLPGMYVHATLERGATKGVLAPQRAVAREPNGDASVMVVGAGDKAEARPVTVAQTVGDQWLVTKGLNAGDRVIVEGLQKVRPGAPVHPVAIATKG